MKSGWIFGQTLPSLYFPHIPEQVPVFPELANIPSSSRALIPSLAMETALNQALVAMRYAGSVPPGLPTFLIIISI